MGLGMQLAVAGDVRVVADSARFAVPVAKLGLMVDHWTIDRVRRLFGEAPRHLVLTGAVLVPTTPGGSASQVRGGLDDAVALATSAAGLAPLSPSGVQDQVDVSSGHRRSGPVCRGLRCRVGQRRSRGRASRLHPASLPRVHGALMPDSHGGPTTTTTAPRKVRSPMPSVRRAGSTMPPRSATCRREVWRAGEGKVPAR